MGKHPTIADLPDGTVVGYAYGTHVTMGIICRPPHIGETVVFTPRGYSGVTGTNEGFWSVVPDADEAYRADALQAEREYRQGFTLNNNNSRR